MTKKLFAKNPDWRILLEKFPDWKRPLDKIPDSKRSLEKPDQKNFGNYFWLKNYFWKRSLTHKSGKGFSWLKKTWGKIPPDWKDLWTRSLTENRPMEKNPWLNITFGKDLDLKRTLEKITVWKMPLGKSLNEEDICKRSLDEKDLWKICWKRPWKRFFAKKTSGKASLLKKTTGKASGWRSAIFITLLLSGEPLRASDRDPEGCAILRPGEPPQVHVRRSGPHQTGPTGQVSTQRHKKEAYIRLKS